MWQVGPRHRYRWKFLNYRMKFGTDIHAPQRMKPAKCGDPLNFPPAQSVCQKILVEYLNIYLMDCQEHSHTPLN